MIARILCAADFERVLKTPTCARTAHFALHFLAGVPTRRAVASLEEPKLSTGAPESVRRVVDESVPEPVCLGLVVPKRHARRAVTRNLLKRQIRQLVRLHLVETAADAAPSLPSGLWVVRLRQPFDPSRFHSADSEGLRRSAAKEIGLLLSQAVSRGAV